MRRRLFNFCSLVSLFLCLATGAMWVWTRRMQGPVVPVGYGPLRYGGVQDVLVKRWRELRFDEMALADVLEFMQQATGVKMQVDWVALESTNIDRVTSVSLRAKDMHFGTALAKIISVSPDLEYVTEGETIYISTRKALANSHRRRRAVNVGVLAEPWQDPRLNFGNIEFVSTPLPSGPTAFELVVLDRRWTFSARHGALCIGLTPSDPAQHCQIAPPMRATKGSNPEVQIRFAGFSLVRGFAPFSCWVVDLPLWCPLVLFAILPLLRERRSHTLRRRRLLGLCNVCGYDLRATPGRCPECGTIPAKASLVVATN